MSKYTFSTQTGKAYYCNSIPGFIADTSHNIVGQLVHHLVGAGFTAGIHDVSAFENQIEEKMEIKNVELYNNILVYNNEVLYSQIRELEAKIKELKSENRRLKSDIDYLETQNKVLRINNENLESDIMDYKVRIDCLTKKLVEK